MTPEKMFNRAADAVIKIAALVGIAAALTAFGYNHYLCFAGGWFSYFALPVYALAAVVFSIALGLNDEVFGNFRDIKFDGTKASSRLRYFIVFAVGSLFELSLWVVAFTALKSALGVPNCAA